MIPIHAVGVGNWVQVNLDGQLLAGKVQRKSVERIGVAAEGELGWYFPKDVYPIQLTDDWLRYFNFEKSVEPELNGGVTYKHGPFILQFPEKENRDIILLTCHGSFDREFKTGLFVHDLQNHYHEMTKVYIE